MKEKAQLLIGEKWRPHQTFFDTPEKREYRFLHNQGEWSIKSDEAFENILRGLEWEKRRIKQWGKNKQ